MPIDGYGVLKGKAIDMLNGLGLNPHFQVKVSDEDLFRIAINVKSQEEPSTVLFYEDDDFNHPILKDLVNLPSGFKDLKCQPDGMALDFIRGNLFDVTKMKLLPCNVPGPDNDLNEILQKYVRKAISMENSEIYAFGQRWGPENKRDQYFGFKPGNGIHDIHMNQGNSENWKCDDGIWQDGGIIFHFPDEKKWVAIFLAFQSQSFHTDDITGNAIKEAVEKRLRIISALVNPIDTKEKTVTILNSTSESISLKGWKLVDRNKMKFDLAGTLVAGDALRVRTPQKAFDLPLSGGIITLLDNKGLKVDGVSYTEKDASGKGWTIVF